MKHPNQILNEIKLVEKLNKTNATTKGTKLGSCSEWNNENEVEINCD